MIIWLASYPKSGNTWLRMFLKSYYQKSSDEFKLQDTIVDDFKTKGFPDISSMKHLKIDFYKFPEIVKNWETMQDYLNLNNRTNFVKTHNSMCTIGPYKFTTNKNTKGGIYLVRDPREVLISYSNHMGYDYEKTFEFMEASDSYEVPTTGEGDKTYKKSLLGSWANNYNSWKSYQPSKILVVKYEDMVLNKLNTFKKIIYYLNEIDDVEINEQKLNKALKQTEFEELQKLEKKHGFNEKRAGATFFRKGKTGSWKNELPVDLVKKIEKAFYNEMTELGYL